MSVQGFEGFEIGDFTNLSPNGSGQSIQRDVIRSGAFALKMDGTVGNGETAIILPSLYGTLFVKINFMCSAIPTVSGSSAPGPLQLKGSNNTGSIYVFGLQSGGTMTVLEGAGFTVVGSGTKVFSPNVWYRLEVKVVIGAGTGSVEVKVDGTVDQTYTARTNNAAGNIGSIQPINDTGGAASNMIFWVDDVKWDDAAYPGDSAVVARQATSVTPFYDNHVKSMPTPSFTSLFNTGFENSLAEDTISPPAQASLVTSPVFSGSKALQIDGTTGSPVDVTMVTSLNAPQVYGRFMFRYDTITNANAGFCLILSVTGANNIYEFALNSSKQIEIFENSGFTLVGTGSTVLSANTWYLIEVYVFIGSGVGQVIVKLNGGVEIALSGRTNNANGNVNTFLLTNDTGVNASGGQFWFDDLDVDIVPIGPVPTINQSWVTPWSPGGGCNSGTTVGAIAQTGVTQSFSAPSDGNGRDVVGPQDTINAVKAAVVAKTSTTASGGAAGAIRYRTGGADTDTAQTLTTSSAYYETAIFSDTLANLNASEVGWAKSSSAGAALHVVDSAWLMVDYTPGPAPTFADWPIAA